MNRSIFLALLSLAACSPRVEPADAVGPESAPPSEAFAPKPTDAPAGTYRLEKSHASLLFRVDHIGFSNYTARFITFDATLELDPAHPENAMLSASIDPASIETDFPYPELEDFNAVLAGPQWLDAAAHPQMTFRSTAIDITGPDTALITGDFTLRGVTHPLVLETRFNGGYKGFPPYDPQARIGFSAHGSLKRSDYGVSYGLPSPEFPVGVGDDVEIILEVEFSGPKMAEADAAVSGH